MGNYEQLKQAVADVIKTNGNQEITGEILQNALLSIISTIGTNATFAGIATPTTNPGTPDQNVFYIATTVGSYSNFGNIEVSKGQSAILMMNNSTWVKNTFKPITDFNSVFDANGKSLTEFESGIVYDVSAHNDNAVFESLSALLSNANLNTLIPPSVRSGGMSIRFIQGSVPNSDNKYVQYRLMATSFSATPSDWQSLNADDEPTTGSDNLVKSGKVAKLDNLNNLFNGNNFKLEDGNPYCNTGKYNTDGTISSDENYTYTNKIKVYPQQTINVRASNGSTKNISIITVFLNGNIHYTVAPEDYNIGVKNYSYTVPNLVGNWEVAICAYSLKESSYSIQYNIDNFEKISEYAKLGYVYQGMAVPSTSPTVSERKIFYLASQSGTYTHFLDSNSVALTIAKGISVLKYDGNSWSIDYITYIEDPEGGIYINPNIIIGKMNQRGSISTNASFNLSEVLNVCAGDIISYTGISGNSSVSAICGWDENGDFVEVLQGNGGIHNQKVTIPSSVKKIQVCVGNNTRADYIQENIVIYRNVKNIDLEPLKDDIQELEGPMVYEEEVCKLYNISGGIFWNRTYNPQYFTVGTYYLRGFSGLQDVQLRETYGGTLVRNIPYVETNKGYEIEIIQSDIEDGHFFRVAANSTQEEISVILRKVCPRHCLYGKKIAVIGDSISTMSGKNTPYWEVKSIDVGNTIQSYVSWFDIYETADTSSPTNKTIGGITLTAAMIGTLQTFTPASDDVGKQIGVAYNFNGVGLVAWEQKLANMTGAILLANASYSGASMCDGQSGEFTNSHAFSDYTIGRCKIRDDEGNFITPDVIFIYRGTNDMTHSQGGQGYSVLDEYNLADGYPVTDINGDGKYSFKRAYYMTIEKLRVAYPKALIYCCTLNVFKRIIYDHFPTRNGLYTLPQMNNAIREIANTMGCGIVEFDKDGITFENCYNEGYITDSSEHPTHPSGKGHAVMADKAMADVNFVIQR